MRIPVVRVLIIPAAAAEPEADPAAVNPAGTRRAAAQAADAPDSSAATEEASALQAAAATAEDAREAARDAGAPRLSLSIN